MAVITRFSRARKTGGRRNPTDTKAEYWTFVDGGSREKIIQIVTVGSDQRQNLGATSQTIQLDRSAALALLKILAAEFSAGDDKGVGSRA